MYIYYIRVFINVVLDTNHHVTPSRKGMCLYNNKSNTSVARIVHNISMYVMIHYTYTEGVTGKFTLHMLLIFQYVYKYTGIVKSVQY